VDAHGTAPIVFASSGPHKVVGPRSEENGIMLNKFVLFCAFAIFMLVAGGVIAPVWAHDDCGDGGKHSAGHPHCDVDPPPAESYPLYDVIIGDVGSPLLGVGTDFIWNGRQVGSTYEQGREFPLEMTYIQFTVGPGCFPSLVKFGGFFRKHKGSTANGMLWFWGTTIDPAETVLYLLRIDGYFAGGPEDGFPGNDKIMYMEDWTLTVSNEGADVASRSCEGSGTFGDHDVPVIFIAK
jgi:hypothetical protein